MFRYTHMAAMVVVVAHRWHVRRVGNPGWYVVSRCWPATLSAAESILTNKFMDHLELELSQVAFLSMLTELLLDYVGIEHCPSDALPIDSNVPLVRAATPVDATHLVVQVDGSGHFNAKVTYSVTTTYGRLCR